jgi:oligopeptide/dipeptide ABC transporter ATP-binding protein
VTAPLLAVEDLAVRFATDAGDVPAVRGVSFCIGEGETVALVGESGCGKSVTALAIMRLIHDPGRIAQGRVRLRGRDLAALSETEMQRIRGDEIGMVFQEPMTSLNPVFKIGDQIGEVLVLHRGMGAERARQEAVRLLEMVGIPSPARRVEQYPHELSGGMKQRVMIAMALACRPALLIADEPTTALDVTIQAQILELLAALQRELGMAILLITHNLGVVAHFAERAAVMYAGRIMEEASVRELFQRPLHPYTRALLRSLPSAGGPHARLEAIAGNVPSPLHLPDGCGFSTRCPEVIERCHREDPALERVEDAHLAACWLDEQGGTR